MTTTLRNDSLFLDELYIYGSQRIGVLKEQGFLAQKENRLPFGLQHFAPPQGLTVTSPLTPQTPQPLTQYKKRYELTDWLGNVRVVITNKKIPLQSAPLRYKPDVVSVTDYYPFGSEVRERSYEKSYYKYGFNGQIEDNEITGNNGSHLAFEYRIYDSRLAKFLSVDPLMNSYPWNSTYAFAENRVIDGVDLEGREYKKSTRFEIDNFKNNGNGSINPGEKGYVYRIGESEFYTWVGNHLYKDAITGNVTKRSVSKDRETGDKHPNTRITFDVIASSGILSFSGVMLNGLHTYPGITILNQNGEMTTQFTNEHGMVELPENGFGYGTYGRNDETHPTMGNIQDQWGSPARIADMINMAAEFKAKYNNATLMYGDISMPNGGSPWFKNSKGKWRQHSSHVNGNYFDMRNIGDNGSYRGYAGKLTNISMLQSFINIANNHGYDNNYMGVYLNNKVTGNGLNFRSDHNDHYHFGR